MPNPVFVLLAEEFCFDFSRMTLGDIIQILIFFGLIFYVLYTKGIMDASKLNLEYNTRPVVGTELSKESEKAHICLKIVNYSNADAIGLVVIRFTYDGKEHSLDDPSYEGKALWYFPAHDMVQGHMEFSGKLKTLDALRPGDKRLGLVAYLYFKVWSHDKKEIASGRRYYCPVKEWYFNDQKNIWIPELTSKTNRVVPEPDWEIFAK